MQSLTNSIQFLQAIKETCNLIDPDNMLPGAIEHLELFQRRHVQNPEAYITEIPKDEYVVWLKFREAYLHAQSQELELVES